MRLARVTKWQWIWVESEEAKGCWFANATTGWNLLERRAGTCCKAWILLHELDCNAPHHAAVISDMSIFNGSKGTLDFISSCEAFTNASKSAQWEMAREIFLESVLPSS